MFCKGLPRCKDRKRYKTCTGIKKSKKNKPLDAQNLHRHQKKQKNQTLSIYSGLGVYRLQKFCFFSFFDACAGFVHLVVCFFCFFLMPANVLQRSAFCFFLFFLMPAWHFVVFFGFFDACAGLVKVMLWIFWFF